MEWVGHDSNMARTFQSTKSLQYNLNNGEGDLMRLKESCPVLFLCINYDAMLVDLSQLTHVTELHVGISSKVDSLFLPPNIICLTFTLNDGHVNTVGRKTSLVPNVYNLSWIKSLRTLRLVNSAITKVLLIPSDLSILEFPYGLRVVHCPKDIFKDSLYQYISDYVGALFLDAVNWQVCDVANCVGLKRLCINTLNENHGSQLVLPPSELNLLSLEHCNATMVLDKMPTLKEVKQFVAGKAKMLLDLSFLVKLTKLYLTNLKNEDIMFQLVTLPYQLDYFYNRFLNVKSISGFSTVRRLEINHTAFHDSFLSVSEDLDSLDVANGWNKLEELHIHSVSPLFQHRLRMSRLPNLNSFRICHGITLVISADISEIILGPYVIMHPNCMVNLPLAFHRYAKNTSKENIDKGMDKSYATGRKLSILNGTGSSTAVFLWIEHLDDDEFEISVILPNNMKMSI